MRRRAWHRAAAAPRPDEDVAAGLERSAGRTLAAAQASLQAGAFDRALDLRAAVKAGPLDELQSARADLLRGQVAFASGLGSDAPPLLLKAARRLEPLDPALARETYLDAWQAAMFAGHLAVGADLVEVSRTAGALPPSADPPRRGLAAVVVERGSGSRLLRASLAIWFLKDHLRRGISRIVSSSCHPALGMRCLAK